MPTIPEEPGVRVESTSSTDVAPPPRRSWSDVLERMGERMQAQGYSPRTRASYLDWVRRLSLAFPDVPLDKEAASKQVQRFLHQMAVGKNLSPASLAQARNALAWLVRRELGLDLELEKKGEAHRGKRLPQVISPEQVRVLLKACPPPWDLFFSLQYGCGLRLAEILDLRIQEVDFSREVVTVRHGKGDKDRLVPLPKALRAPLKEHLEKRRRQWEQDHAAGLDVVDLPNALARKLVGAERSWEWQHVFGNIRPLRHPDSGELRRFRPLENTVREALHDAAKSAGIEGRVHPHLLRHCYATHLLEAGTSLRNIQELMGHARLETTMVYMHVRTGATVPASPLDRL
jgi:integron integrase